MAGVQQLPRTFFIGMSLLFSLLGLAYLLSLMEFNKKRSAMPVLGTVDDFTLTNQDGRIFTLADLTNHVWIGDIIFTRCAGPCPRMTGQMKSLGDKLSPEARLVTLTTDPDYDTPAVLKKYGNRFQADFSRWNFLTGTKSEIATVAAGSLKLSAVPVASAEQQNASDLFIHTTIFVAVDKHARLRAVFETGGDGIDWTNDILPQITRAVRELEQEK